ncbi:MAG: RNA polymerase sigma factor [Pseudomonadota bacterium]
MAETSKALRELFLARYQDLRRRLVRRLGSADLASEVLQETWLRLESGTGDGASIQRPQDYIFRVALNIANDHRRSDQRRLTYSEVEALYHFSDATLDAEQVLEARSELRALERAFRGLSPRQRAILIAVRLDGTTHAELAQRFRISERMVDKDLRRALEHCSDQLDRTLFTRFGSRPPKTSIK